MELADNSLLACNMCCMQHDVCAARSVVEVDVRQDSVDGCAGQTRKQRFGCTVGISDQYLVGWVDCDTTLCPIKKHTKIVLVISSTKLYQFL